MNKIRQLANILLRILIVKPLDEQLTPGRAECSYDIGEGDGLGKRLGNISSDCAIAIKFITVE